MPWTNIPTFTVGQILTSTVMNQFQVNGDIGNLVCTSTSRPAAPETGQTIYETDTNRNMKWSGAAWVDHVTATPAGGELAGTYPNPTVSTLGNVPIHNSSTTLSLRTGNVERIAVDSAGRVRQPYQPCCQLYRDATATAGGVIYWTGTHGVNTGSMWDGSTAVYAPITGIYRVAMQGMSANVINAAYCDIYKNSVYQNRRGYSSSTASGHKWISIDSYIAMNANEYIQWLPNGGDMYSDVAVYLQASLMLVS